MSHSPAILAEGLHKYYGKIHALDGLDLAAEKGSILAVLGPNGSGKTTTIRILTTLLKPDRGHAEVAGLDVVKNAGKVRTLIGLAGQNAAIDENLTGYENLEMFGELYHLSGIDARRRADELIEQFDLGDAGKRLVKTYSGGMRRRLDLAASLIMSPPILFLDEPTTGLDPRGRLAVWVIIRNLVAKGTTVLLTTQYMDEADELASKIIVMDQGHVIAGGTANELKTRIGGARLDMTLAPGGDLPAALQVIRPYGSGEIQIDDERRHLVMPLTDGGHQLTAIVHDLDIARISLEDFALRHPTLDDVFLSLTGRTAAVDNQQEKTVKARHK